MYESRSGKRGQWSRVFLRMLVVTLIVGGSLGLSCDSEAASTFRSVATSEIGDGVRTIMNGVLDGLIAAVEEAGDGD